MSTTQRPAVWLAVVTSVLLFSTLGSARLWDQDEPRNAGCAAEMLMRGDWVTPVFNGELRGHKPVLLYWCMMAIYGVLGVSEFSARFSSAAFGLGTVLITYGIGRRFAGVQAGVLSGLILATTLMFGVAARAATPDAPLIFFTTLALGLLVRAVVPTSSAAAWNSAAWGKPHGGSANLPLQPLPAGWSFRLTFYGAIGLAVLAKGPIGLVLPLAVAGCFLWSASLPHYVLSDAPLGQRLGAGLRHLLRTVWSMHPLTGLVIVLLVAAPWYVWVGYRTDGAWLREFFLEHNWQRARRPMEGHSGPPFYYLLAILPGFFPWSIFFVPTLLEAWRRAGRGGADRLLVAFAASWLIVWVCAFSLASTKLPSYITPCYPALAVLTAGYLVRWTKCQELVSPVWPWLSLLSLLLAGAGMAAALPWAATRYLPGEQWLGLLGVIPLAAALCGAWWYHQQQRWHVVRVTAVAACLFALAMFGLAAARVDRHQHSGRLLDTIARTAGEPRVAYLGGLEPSWVFYAGRPLEEVTLAGEPPSEPAALQVIGRTLRPREAQRWDEFLAGGADRFVITTRQRWEELDDSPTCEVVAEVPYFLKDERLVLLRGRAAAADRTYTASRIPLGERID